MAFFRFRLPSESFQEIGHDNRRDRVDSRVNLDIAAANIAATTSPEIPTGK